MRALAYIRGNYPNIQGRSASSSLRLSNIMSAMAKYESGREVSLLEDIRKGTKTVEIRLRRGKFAQYQPGDRVWLRADTYEGDRIVSSEPRQVLVEVTRVEPFDSFRELLAGVGYAQVVPRARNAEEALAQPYRFYSPEEERQYGALAIHFQVIQL